MTREEFIKRAGRLFPDMCCSESILQVGAEYLGIESDLVPAVAAGFEGGMMFEKKTCGALTGAIMVLGLASRQNTDLCLENAVPELMGRFHERCGTTSCFELTGLDLKNPEQMGKLNVKLCRAFVRLVGGHLYDILTETASE
mgnify:FL=1